MMMCDDGVPAPIPPLWLQCGTCLFLGLLRPSTVQCFMAFLGFWVQYSMGYASYR